MARVLVIDDEELICEMLEDALTAAGHEVAVAPDGRRGVQLLQGQAVDLIIADIFMPEKDGLETIVELRRTHGAAKIIAISGGSKIRNADVLRWAGELGASHTFRKPIDWGGFLAAVDECLGANGPQ